MPDTLETFVGRLQAEGVEAGKEAAARIQAEAEQKAKHLLQQAEAEAARILERAEQETISYRERVESDLRLATRDAVLTLRETLSRMLERVLKSTLEHSLQDGAFLRELIREVLTQYAEADSEGQGDIQINLTAEMEQQLANWAVHELRLGLEGGTGRVVLHGTLNKAGLEYHVTGGTVEVTAESLATLLSGLVHPELHRILDEVDSSRNGGGNGNTNQERSTPQ